MATIGKPLARELVANDGNYPGDPQCLAVYSYENRYGGTCYSVCYTFSDVNRLQTSPDVIACSQLWSKESGLTELGEEFLKQ